MELYRQKHSRELGIGKLGHRLLSYRSLILACRQQETKDLVLGVQALWAEACRTLTQFSMTCFEPPLCTWIYCNGSFSSDLI